MVTRTMGGAKCRTQDLARAIVAAVESGRAWVVVSARLGVVLTTMALVPEKARRCLAHALHLDTAFTRVDPQVRANYRRRITASE